MFTQLNTSEVNAVSKLPQLARNPYNRLSIILENPQPIKNALSQRKSIKEIKRKTIIGNNLLKDHFPILESSQNYTTLSPQKGENNLRNPFLKYDPSLMLANIKAQDHRKHLLNFRQSTILQGPIFKKKMNKKRQDMYSLDTEANTASLETLKSLNMNYSADLDLPSITSESSDELNNKSYEEILENYGRKGEKNLPINKIPLSTRYNWFLNNKKSKQNSIIQEYDGHIRKFPKVCYYLEYQRKLQEKKINRLLLRAKSFDENENFTYVQNASIIKKSLDNENYVSSKKVNVSEELLEKIKTEEELSEEQKQRKPKFKRRVYQKKNEKKPNVSIEQKFHTYMLNQLTKDKINIPLQKLCDRYQYQKFDMNEYIQLPYVDQFDKILKCQFKIFDRISPTLSKQNQISLKKQLKNIYSQLVISNLSEQK